MEFTVEDLVNAKQGDFEAQKKMVACKEQWDRFNSRYPRYNLDRFEFSDCEKQEILSKLPDFAEAMNVLEAYKDAVIAGEIKVSTWGTVLKNSFKKWLKTITLPEHLKWYDFRGTEFCYCGTSIYLDDKGYYFNTDEVLNRFVSGIYAEAEEVVLKADDLVQLHKKAYDLFYEYCEHGNCRAFKHLGWTTGGYRGNTSLAIWDDNDNNARVLTKPELEQVISIIEEYKTQVEAINEELAKKVSIKH